MKEVASQYTDTITLKDVDLEQKEIEITKLEAALKKMQTINVDDSETNLSFDDDMKEVGSVISVSPTHVLPSTPITKVIKPKKNRLQCF